MKEIGARIRARRERLTFSQEMMAARLSMSVANYSRIEAGKTGLSAVDIVTLADGLNVSPTWLFSEVDEPWFPQNERDILALYRVIPTILQPTAHAVFESLAKQRDALENIA